MQHKIPISQLEKKIGPQLLEMTRAVETCVHCGFCLPACPTYQLLGEEMDSPRGRIVLMKSVLEGELQLDEAMLYLDRCLGCQACVTICPSGVHYGELITPFRAYARGNIHAPVSRQFQRTLLERTLPYPGRFRAATALGKIAKPLHRALPDFMAPMLSLLPDNLPEYQSLPELVPARGLRKGRVALLAGCVQQVLEPEINWATIRVLARNGIEVILPKTQTCCGALSIHTGDHDQARLLARQNLRAFPEDVDAILTNAAGCGSGMKEYPLLFKGLPEEHKAVAFAEKVMDISEYLSSLELDQVSPLSQPLTAAYHDACHLAFAQGITLAPRKLLTAIPNLTLLEISDTSNCCGSAGSYNVEQPDLAVELGQRKAESILNSGAQAVITGNIGCMVQLRMHLKLLGKPLPVYHTVEMLDLAYSVGEKDR
jgi:glycolate oxidase iron-sulfur subunit